MDIISILIEVVFNIISIVAAVFLVIFGERYRIGRGKAPQDEATCALHILRVLGSPKRDTPSMGMTWRSLYEEATTQINRVTEGGNYSGKLPRQQKRDKKDTHANHMHKALDHLLRQGLMWKPNAGDDSDDCPYEITTLGSRLLQRTNRYKSMDERDAVFEDFYLNGTFSAPPGEDYDQGHHDFLDRLLPEGQKGQIIFREDCKSSILFLLRFRSVAPSEHLAGLPAVEWITVEFKSKEGLSTRESFQTGINYGKAAEAEIFEIQPDEGGIEHRLSQVRNKIDMAWEPNELLAGKFDAIDHPNEVHTLAHRLAPIAVQFAIDYVMSGWLGRFGSSILEDRVLAVLNDAAEREGLGSIGADSMRDDLGEHMLRPVKSENLRCVAWAALIPKGQ